MTVGGSVMAEPSLTAYMGTLFGDEDELLRSMRLEAEQEGIPLIQVPLELGRLLSLLIVQSAAKRILEVGTLFGYSAILMARAMAGDGRITTLEFDPHHAEVAARNLQRAGVADRVEIKRGAALESLAALQGESFDLVFIDADKTNYPAYLDWALQLTHPGSVIVADNVWRGGTVVDPGQEDSNSVAMRQFNQKLAAESRLISTIVPTKDGADAAAVGVVRGR